MSRNQKVDTGEWARYWQVTPRTVQRWLRQHLPVSDPEQMALHIRSMAKPARAALAVAEKVLIDKQKRGGADFGLGVAAPPVVVARGVGAKDGPPVEDPDWQDFVSGTDDGERVLSLEEQRDFFVRKLQQAIRYQKHADQSFYSERVMKYEAAIRQNKLMAERLGIDEGKLLPQADVENYLWAVAFWSMLSVSQTLRDLCPKLVGLDFPEEIWNVLEPYLLDNRFLSPLSKAVTMPSGVSLPDWFVEALREAVDDFLENGSAEWNKRLAAWEAARKEGDDAAP